jgi:hypothetical protein
MTSKNNLKNNPVDHPAHYTSHPSGVEAIEIAEHFNFNRGNAFKYCFRAHYKGKTLEDLKKARWYIKRELFSKFGIKNCKNTSRCFIPNDLAMNAEIRNKMNKILNKKLNNLDAAIAFIVNSWYVPYYDGTKDNQCSKYLIEALYYINREIKRIQRAAQRANKKTLVRKEEYYYLKEGEVPPKGR